MAPLREPHMEGEHGGYHRGEGPRLDGAQDGSHLQYQYVIVAPLTVPMKLHLHGYTSLVAFMVSASSTFHLKEGITETLRRTLPTMTPHLRRNVTQMATPAG